MSPHRRRRTLAGVRIRCALPDDLVHGHGPQPPYDGRTQQEADQQGRHEGRGSAKGDVVEQVEQAHITRQWLQEIVEH